MITDERLKAFAEYDDELEDWEIVNVFNEIIPEIASELLTLRQQNKALIEDAERLYVRTRHFTDCPAYNYKDSPKYCNCGVTKIDAQHNALMKEINE